MNSKSNPSGGRSNRSTKKETGKKPNRTGASAKFKPTAKAGAKPTARPGSKTSVKPGDKPTRTTNTGESKDPKSFSKGGKPFVKWEKKRVGDPLPSMNENEIRLNKFLSNAGICSRREADVLIETGVVTVNGKIVTEMGYKVSPDDHVQYDGETINSEKKQYVLLNKPKDFITSTNDPWGRKTVMALIGKACKERVYPVGRLDRETTGLMLFTNDGDLTKKLLHPVHLAASLYHLEADKPVKPEDLAKIIKGVEVDGAVVKVSKAEHVTGKGNYEVGVEINSDKSHSVRRVFERLGYKVLKLDRVMFAGLTKKDLPRGHYRLLTAKEISFLRMNEA
jgi:23S rRNA pseudouridine2605 synthase